MDNQLLGVKNMSFTELYPTVNFDSPTGEPLPGYGVSCDADAGSDSPGDLTDALKRQRSANSMEMPVIEFQAWYNALTGDHLAQATKILEGAYASGRDILLNGNFVFKSADLELHSDFVNDYAFCKPLCLTAVFLAENCLPYLLREQADPCLLDVNDNNVVHAICWATQLNPDKETQYIELYEALLGTISVRQRYDLLMQENTLGLRPLELAGSLSRFLLMYRIMQTDRVYRFQIRDYGMHSCALYHVTEYETTETQAGPTEGRFQKSPVRMLSHVTLEQLSDRRVSDVFTSPLFQTWHNVKMSRLKPVIVVWLLTRIVYALSFALLAGDLFDAGGVSVKSEHFKQSNHYKANCTLGNSVSEFLKVVQLDGLIRVIVFGISTVVIIFDILEYTYFWWERKKHKAMHGCFKVGMSGGVRAVSNNSYRYMITFQAVFSIFSYVLKEFMKAMHSPLVESIFVFLYSVICVMNFWNVLFFVQLSRAFGHFVITFQRMLRDLGKFLILYVLISVSFNHAIFSFRAIGCLPVDENYLLRWYDTFLISLNIVENFKFASRNIQYAFLVFHVLYVFVVGILTVNFLIAVMANSVSVISENKSAVLIANRLSVLFTVEGRVGLIANRLFPFWYFKDYVQIGEKLYISCFDRKRVIGGDGPTT